MVTVGLLAAFVMAQAASAAPGGWSQAQVNTAITSGVAYLDGQQNADGSYGNGTVAETGIALAAYGVLANGNFSSLPASYQTHVQNAINFLLSQQNTSATAGPNSAFGEIENSGYPTYETGLALTGLSYFTAVNAGVPTAITDGREFLVNEFEGPTNDGCSSVDPTPTTVSPTGDYCGGWNYDPGDARSDESNSGYAVTGLELTGGIPNVAQSDGTTLVQDNIDWNHHIQVISSNPFMLPANGGSGDNDGGGAYQPAYAAAHPNDFASNANDSGTMLFSYGDDSVASSDPHVAAAITFNQDVLNSYELEQADLGAANIASMQQIYHSGATEDGSCTPDAAGCDWLDDGDGGYHYSLFALTKGLGSYIAPDLSDATNWYAKVVDLLLSQQAADGSWPANGRDDYDNVFASGLAVASLGLVAVRPETTLTTSLSGGGQTGATISVPSGTAVTDAAALSGTNASTATGTVTYNVYSDNGCTKLVSAGTAETITSPGTLPASAPQTFSAAGTYYWQATYSGDSNNGPSANRCGSEVETVTAAHATVKICKVAGSGVKLGTPVGFTVGGGEVTVPAGPPPGGYCKIIKGKFAAGQKVHIVEQIPNTMRVTAIHSRPKRVLVSKNPLHGTATAVLVSGVNEVTFTDEVVPGTGWAEICESAANGVSGYYSFVYDATTVRVPVGACSAAFKAPAGALTIHQKRNDSSAVTTCKTRPSGRLLQCNPTRRTAIVAIVPGHISTETIVKFVNT